MAYYKRLKLDKVTEKSCDGTIVHVPYSFTYNGTFLPYRLSKSTDHWGYYNGVAANENLKVSVPPTTLPVSGTNTTFTYGSANKESNEIEMKKGMLTQIGYPTGGNTWFSYEANVVNANVASTVNKLSLQSCLNTPPNCCGTQTATSGNIQFTAAELDFANNPNTSTFKIQLWPLATNNGGSQIPCSTATMVTGTVQAFRSSDNAAVGQPYSFNINATESTNSIEKALTFLQGPSPYLTFLPSTNYYFKITTANAYGTLTITSNPVTYQNYTVGGLRIKEIRSSAGNTQTVDDVIKSYEYLQQGSTTTSSGSLFLKPLYGFTTDGVATTTTGISTQMVRMFFQENSLSPLYNFSGNHCGYQWVKEKHNGNGEKMFKYDVSGSVAPAIFPAPPVSVNVNTGQSQKEQVYSSTGTLVAETALSGQSLGLTTNARMLWKTVQFPFSCINVGGGTTQGFLTGTANYFITNSAYVLSSSTETIDGVSTTTTYSYDNTYRFLAPKVVQVTNSDNKVTRTDYSYPHDMAAGCLRDLLLQKNIIASPWKTVVKVGSTDVAGMEIVYAAFFPTGAFSSLTTCAATTIVRPYEFKTYEMTWDNAGTASAGTWVTKGTINSYTSKGFPAAYTAVNWLPETYTWETNGLIKTKTYNGYVSTYDYHPGTQLVAKITQPDGQEAWYDYDKLARLSKTSVRPSTANSKTTATVTTNYEYRYRAQTIPPNPYAENYTRTTTAFATAPTGAGTSGLTSQENIQFFDGLGRTYQTVNRKQSPASVPKDVIVYIKYDKWGRVSKSYNPVESTNNTGAQLSAEPTGTPFSLSEYYADPLNRIWKTTPPSWYPTTYAYGANGGSEVLLNHTSSTYYDANSLMKTTVTDPDNKVAISYNDKSGRALLLKRTDTANSQASNTYSIYDDKNRLTLVIPPGSSFINSTLNFAYTYDAADHLVTKKVPDAAIVTMKYNTRDQLVLEQDGNLVTPNKWRCIQYDDFGRVVKTGLYNDAIPTTIPSPIPPSLAPNDVYTENTYGTSGIQKGKIIKTKAKILDTGNNSLESNYTYDGYGRTNGSTGNNYLLPADLNAESITLVYDYADNILKDTRVSKKTASVSYTITQKHNYDHWGRNTLNTHQMGTGTEYTLSQLNYDWKNQVIEKNLGKTPSATNYLQSLDYAYNNLGWLTTINAPTLGGTNTGFPACPSGIQVMPDPNPGATNATPDFNDLFYLELKYDILQTGWSGPGPKNGNIGQVIWRTRGRERQLYTLTYDYLNRMTDAQYHNLSDGGSTNNPGAWNENLVYDARGNINSLTRNGKYKSTPSATCWTDGQIDNLAYTYTANTNKLQKIADGASNTYGWTNPANAAATSQYLYDANGNLTKDPYKNMTVGYNFMNLPQTMTFPVAAGVNNTIEIIYDGTGRKLRKIVKNANLPQYTQDYVGGIEYRTTSTVPLSLESINHAEGRVFNTNTGTTSADALRYEYAIQDHLGNTRLTFTDKNGNGVVDVTNTGANEVLQENHYYPFGLAMNGPWMNDNGVIDNKYQYNGKELNDDFDLGWNDYGARWYDPSVGRWWSVDPLAEMVYRENSYCYAGNNPINNVDIGGLFKINPKGTHSVLESYLNSGDIGRLLQNPDLRNGLKTIGNFSEQQLNDMAEPGKGPEIFIVPDDKIGAGPGMESNGSFRSKDGDGSFNISQTLVDQLQNATPENKQAALLFLVMTIFHESVHLGVNKNSTPRSSLNGNWEKRGFVYYFKGIAIAFKEGTDKDPYIRKNPDKYKNVSAVSEDGHTLEDNIWFNFTSKRGEINLEEGKAKINTVINPDVVPKA